MRCLGLRQKLQEEELMSKIFSDSIINLGEADIRLKAKSISVTRG